MSVQQRSYDYVVYQIENSDNHQTEQFTMPIAAFTFQSDARHFCLSMSEYYDGLRFIFTGMTAEEVAAFS